MNLFNLHVIPIRLKLRLFSPIVPNIITVKTNATVSRK